MEANAYKAIRTVRPPLKKRAKQNVVGYLFLFPFIAGFLIFNVIPMAASLVYSFHDFSFLTGRMANPGFQNYIALFTTRGDMTWQALKVTFLYTVINVPLSIVLSFALALLLNRNIRGMKVFRLLYYFPVIIPAVASGLMWRYFTDVDFGMGNKILALFGLGPASFFNKYATSMPTLIFMGLFGIGGMMVLWIAQFKAISPSYYESAQLDGAGKLRQIFSITIPMATPIIFYNLITGIIGALQTFTGIYVLTGGTTGKENALLFYCIDVYNEAFNSFNMGMASAMAWLLFVIIGVFTVILFKSSKWVFYGE